MVPSNQSELLSERKQRYNNILEALKTRKVTFFPLYLTAQSVLTTCKQPPFPLFQGALGQFLLNCSSKRAFMEMYFTL